MKMSTNYFNWTSIKKRETIGNEAMKWNVSSPEIIGIKRNEDKYNNKRALIHILLYSVL